MFSNSTQVVSHQKSVMTVIKPSKLYSCIQTCDTIGKHWIYQIGFAQSAGVFEIPYVILSDTILLVN